MTYSDLVTFLLDTASALTYSGTSSGLTIQTAEFGPDANIGLDVNTVYPYFYLTPTKSTIGKESVTSYSFQVIVLDRISNSNNRTDRAEKYSIVFEWLVAYFQYLDQVLTIEYIIENDAIETNYDQLGTGWVGNIKVFDSYNCILTTSPDDIPTNSNLPQYGVMAGTSGTSGTSGINSTSDFGTSGFKLIDLVDGMEYTITLSGGTFRITT